jgi:hypothetical protein
MSIYTTIKMVYIYLLGLREFRITKNPIVKVGKCASYHSRFVNYPNLSEIYSIYDIEDDDLRCYSLDSSSPNRVVDINVENQIIKIFEMIFTKEEKYGKEYFTGDFKKMASIIEIYLESKNIPFSKVDLFNDFFEYNIHKQMIHSSNIWNTNIYNYIIEYMNSKNMDLSILNDPFLYEDFYYHHFCKKQYKEKIDYEEYEKELIDYQKLENEVIQNKIYKNNTKYKYKKTILRICHHCLDYKTQFNRDMSKHFNRKNNCVSNTEYSYEEAKKLTLEKKYIFYIDVNELTNEDIHYIINKFNDKNNYIYDDYKGNNQEQKNILYDEKIDDEELENEESKEDESKEEEFKEEEFKEEESKEDEKEEDIYKAYYNPKINKYVCNICRSTYASKQNMIFHLQNINNCMKKVEVQNLIKNHKAMSKKIRNEK